MDDANDRDAFIDLLTLLGETFNEPVSPLRAKAYWITLADLPLEAVERAVHTALTEARFFPKPVELREYAGLRPPDAGLVEAALVEHLRQPGHERRRPAHPFLALVVERLGGIWQAGGMSSADRLRLIGQVLPGVITAARVRGLPMLTEREVAAALPMPRVRLLVEPEPEDE